jgi:hypothetical protein
MVVVAAAQVAAAGAGLEMMQQQHTCSCQMYTDIMAEPKATFMCSSNYWVTFDLID